MVSGLGVCRKFCQQVAIVQRLFHQFGGGGAQVVHIFRRQIETGRNIQHLVPQLGRRKVFEIEADEREIDVFVLLVFVPLIDKALKRRKDSCECWSIGIFTMAETTSRKPGTAALLSKIAADFVLGIDVDDDNMADFVLFDFVRQDFSGYISVMSKRLRMPDCRSSRRR